ncbi:MAG: BRO family protein [archaeon]
MENKLIVFENKKIRRVWHEDDWWFSVVDVVGVLSESRNPRDYWYRMKTRELECGIELSTNCRQLKMVSEDGKKYMTDCADLKGIFRIIQSISSKNAEPFKIWLANVGSERIDEQVDPELAIDRAMKNYLAKGYSEKWINQRLKTIEVRKELTDEWRRSGVEEGQEFAILTNEITLAWSGKSIRDYKDLKGLRRENLRDNMTNLELALNTLAEATTVEISRKENPEEFLNSLNVARRGGGVAGVARKKIEEELGSTVVSKENYLDVKDKKEVGNED